MHVLDNTNKFSRGFLAFLCIGSLLIFSACTGKEDRQAIDAINEQSYYYHYRNLDSTLFYALKAFDESRNYDNGRAEALNNIAFYYIAKMNYAMADSILNEVRKTSDNEVELLISDVLQMRLCQRRSANKEYYTFQTSAQKRLERIKETMLDWTAEKTDPLVGHLYKRVAYAESEYNIVSSTYYYYVGLEKKSREAIFSINSNDLIQVDSSQVANYLYNVGSGGMISAQTQEDVAKIELIYLAQCQYIADKCNYVFWQANALQAIAELHALHQDSLYIGEAARSLELFKEYGDVYQIAGAYRTLASCYWTAGNYEKSLQNLQLALNTDTRIQLAPELTASIYERLSVVYAALGNMEESLKSRQLYLSLQEGTRQDRYLESRKEELENTTRQMRIMLYSVLGVIVLLILMFIVFYIMNKRRSGNNNVNHLLEPLKTWNENTQLQMVALADSIEEAKEEILIGKSKYSDNIQRYEESRAKISLVNSVVPLIDRMIHEVNSKDGNLEYASELTDKINEYNDILTEWIQMRQGELSLKIESFSLQSLFDIIGKAKASCNVKGIDFNVEDTKLSIKADRILTLFMLNTLIDNATKFTPSGGSIKVYATEHDDYVEMSVEDTGKGLSKEDFSTIFDHKIYDGHGFGLMNCKGIIDKYKKISTRFSQAMISAESLIGKGSRFFFRLPKGKIIALVIAFSFQFCLMASVESSVPKSQPLTLSYYNDSAVAALQNHKWSEYTRMNHKYIQLFKERSIDKSLPSYCLSMQEQQTNQNIAIVLLVVLFLSIFPAYYFLFYRHRLYYLFCVDRIRHINDILFEDTTPSQKLSAIAPLLKEDYPESLKQVVNQIEQALMESQESLEQQHTFVELAKDEYRRIEMENMNLHVSNNVLDNCLSTLKHETMYYPNRIRQLIDNKEYDELPEMVAYYKDLYTILVSQAMREVEKYKPHIECVEIYGEKVLGDKYLLSYLEDLLNTSLHHSVIDGLYIKFTIILPSLLSDEECRLLFTPEGHNIPMLICRQIVREHSEFTYRRGCGIIARNNEGKTEIIITLPRYGKV